MRAINLSYNSIKKTFQQTSSARFFRFIINPSLLKLLHTLTSMQTLSLPTLSPIEQTINKQLIQHIQQQIQKAGGSIPFSQYMRLVLYTPQLGYYSNNTHKIGYDGDFITAPVLTPLFAQTLAIQLKTLLPQTEGIVYEFGAGTGELASGLLKNLNHQVKQYYIIELSAPLAKRQRQYIAQHAPEHLHKVVHLNKLPEKLNGIIIGNEVLDAMPIERIQRNADGSFSQIAISLCNQRLCTTTQTLTNPTLKQTAQHYFPHTQNTYISELHPEQYAFIQTLAERLECGAMIWIDYGFDATQYYHPQRKEGTLIGHYRHHTIHDPFFRIGLTDLTAHVNFTDIAQAACDAHLDLIGYTTQANFLLNLGLIELLAQQYPNTSSSDYVRASTAVQILTAPHEMGELFKVIALGKNIDVDWQGFSHADLCHKL